MKNINFFSLIGCFTIEKFLSPEECLFLFNKACESNTFVAGVINKDNQTVINNNYRQTRIAEVPAKISDELQKKIQLLKPELENHFKLELSSCQKPSFLVYHKGDFFKLHRDQEAEGKTIAGDRKVSIIIFLNNQTEVPTENNYCGGSLNLFGLIDKPGWENKGFPVKGTSGSLIAFRSNILHEVSAVTFGTRVTSVTWFL